MNSERFNSLLKIRMGNWQAIALMDDEEVKVETKKLLKKLAPYFLQDCVFPIRTEIGNDADVYVYIDSKNNKVNFKIEEREDNHELPPYITYTKWKHHIYEMIYINISQGGNIVPLQQSRFVLRNIMAKAKGKTITPQAPKPMTQGPEKMPLSAVKSETSKLEQLWTGEGKAKAKKPKYVGPTLIGEAIRKPKKIKKLKK